MRERRTAQGAPKRSPNRLWKMRQRRVLETKPKIACAVENLLPLPCLAPREGKMGQRRVHEARREPYAGEPCKYEPPFIYRGYFDLFLKTVFSTRLRRGEGIDARPAPGPRGPPRAPAGDMRSSCASWRCCRAGA